MDKIIETILNYVDPDCEITGSSKLSADCGLTSFDMVCLVEELCGIFNTEIDKKALKNCVTVSDLAGLCGIKSEATV